MGVDLDLLKKMLSGEVIPEAMGQYEECYNAQSVCSHKGTCGV
jgi:hypothetical protein